MNKETFIEKYAVERLGTNSLKWDALDRRFGDPNLLAMWVADMEFRTPDEVIKAVTDRVSHGVYGYSYVTDSYYDSVIKWHENRHKVTIKKEWFRFSLGVVASLYWIVDAFTKPGESVMIITPVYYPFHNAVKDNDRKLVRSELINTNGVYTIDFEDFENKIVENQVKLFIQCSPHNPVGRVWTETELDKILSICQKHGVLVVSDEIHQDIIIGDKEFIPAARVGNGKYLDNLITVNAASKSFNLACLLNSHVFISNESIRKQYDAYAKIANQIEVNILGLVATEAAYDYGEEWLSGLLNVIKHNYNYLKTQLAERAPKIVLAELEGTYLTWLDLRAYVKPEDTKAFIQGKCNLAVDFGEWFSDECQGFVRLNMATEPRYVEQAVENIIKNIDALKTGGANENS